MPQSASIDSEEIAQFSRHAADWWNEQGPMRPLHKLNPVRMEYIRDRLSAHFKRDQLKGLSVIDVGCGAGLLCEPLARLGLHVTGLDASDEAITVARQHAKSSRLDITYQAGSAEDFAKKNQRFDIITALEIVEHVADLPSLFEALRQLLKPNGILILSTVNRTPKSFLLGIVAAEYILRWVPRGTHNWKKFVKPSELERDLNASGFSVGDIIGMRFDPLNDRFCLRPLEVDVNYLMSATLN